MPDRGFSNIFRNFEVCDRSVRIRLNPITNHETNPSHTGRARHGPHDAGESRPARHLRRQHGAPAAVRSAVLGQSRSRKESHHPPLVEREARDGHRRPRRSLAGRRAHPGGRRPLHDRAERRRDADAQRRTDRRGVALLRAVEHGDARARLLQPARSKARRTRSYGPRPRRRSASAP